VNPARLGEQFNDPSRTFAIRAPAGWSPLPAAIIHEAMRRVPESGRTDVALHPRMLALYRQDPEGASLAVSAFAGSLGEEERRTLAARYLGSLKSRFPQAKVEEGRFTYRGFDVVQFRVVDPQQVLFKLLVSRSDGPLYQLDYVVPVAVYQRELESIESSIGSLRPTS
jgi:hypothetical protein